MKLTKKQKILKIEEGLFTDDRQTFCISVLGLVRTLTDEDYFYVNKTCTLIYNYLNNRFTLLVPTKIKQQQLNQKYEAIGLDPGIRTFMTGYSKKHTLEIGNNLTETIKKELNAIDSINKSKLSEKKKRIAEHKRYYKISNLIDDLHWKTIKRLTSKYHTILIGNMSTKGIVGNKNKIQLTDMTKRIALIMKLYVFRERLKYKCSIKGCNYCLIDEHFTSQTCTFCGNTKKDLGSQKIYDCKRCKTKIERDVNGARNIYMLGLN
jgi:putative transposase